MFPQNKTKQATVYIEVKRDYFFKNDCYKPIYSLI